MGGIPGKGQPTASRLPLNAQTAWAVLEFEAQQKSKAQTQMRADKTERKEPGEARNGNVQKQNGARKEVEAPSQRCCCECLLGPF